MHTLLMWALLLGAGYPSAKSPASQGELTQVILTNDRPTGSFSIDPGVLASAPPVLKLTITQVFNPTKLPFQIFVFLSYDAQAAEKPGTYHKKILVGNFGLYPPDHPAAFLLSASSAFSKLKSTRSNPNNVRLLLEIRRIHENSPWTLVEVTLAPPEWRRN